MNTGDLDPEVSECIVAVDHRTGEAFVPLAYAATLQARIEVLEAQTKERKMLQTISRYLLNIACALDCLLNAALGGDWRMTLSARMGRDIERGLCKLCRPVCAALSLLQRDHCARSWTAEQRGADASNQVTGD